MEVDVSRQRLSEGAKRGDHTGPNPTDRAKKGVKRHILTDGRGVPLSVCITAANVHDKWLVGEVLDNVIIRAPRGPRRPKHLCLDKGYDYLDAEVEVVVRDPDTGEPRADDDGVVVIPPALLQDVVADAYAQELQDAWVFDRVAEGHPVDGLFPPNAEWKRRYAAVLIRSCLALHPQCWTLCRVPRPLKRPRW